MQNSKTFTLKCAIYSCCQSTFLNFELFKMKYLPTLLLLMVSFAMKGQVTTVVTMNGIGDIKVGMTRTQLEKITGQPVKLVKLLKKEDWDRDTINFIYKDIPYQVILDKDYINEKSAGFIVYEVKSTGTQLKTKSGIGIGDDKIKIINTYHDYMIQIMPQYEDDFTKSKTRSTIWLHGEDGKLIVFYLVNNKVTGFSVMFDEGC